MNRHLEPDQVAAFCARTLNAQERTQIFDHLAGCAACREWIAVTTSIEPPVRSRSKAFAFAAVAATLLLVTVTGWHWNAPAPSSPPALQSVIGDRSASLRDRSNQESAAQPALQLTRRPSTPILRALAPVTAHPGLRHVTLAFSAPQLPPSNQIALQTNVGEKWISIDGAWGIAIVP